MIKLKSIRLQTFFSTMQCIFGDISQNSYRNRLTSLHWLRLTIASISRTNSSCCIPRSWGDPVNKGQTRINLVKVKDGPQSSDPMTRAMLSRWSRTSVWLWGGAPTCWMKKKDHQSKIEFLLKLISYTYPSNSVQ